MKHTISRNTLTSKSILFGLVGLAGASLSGCSNHHDPASAPASIPSAPVVATQISGPATAPAGSTVVVKDSKGTSATLALFHTHNKAMIAVQGTLSEEAFLRLEALYAQKPESERRQLIHQELVGIFQTLHGVGAIPISENDQIAYFKFYLPYTSNVMEPLSKLTFTNQVIMDPVVFNAINVTDDPTPESLGLTPKRSSGDFSAFSGLEKIHAPEFVALAEATIGGGVKVDGSSVNLGVTDTGITYNHPTFLADDGKTVRIQYMKDFTGEASAYFNPAAKFSAVAGAKADEVVINAQVIVTPKLPGVPTAVDFADIKNTTFKVSADLKAKLLDPATTARLGYIDEANYQGGENPVDVNANGKLDDKFPVLLLMGAKGEQSTLYFDPTATNDFRLAQPMGDWNTTHTTISVFAEKFGFHVTTTQLAASDDPQAKGVDVQSVSIVGYDPGPHGTHVSGIAAGRQTITNDTSGTLARGVAPNTNIFLDRVCANNGGCDATAAMADLAENGADIVNMSLGGIDPFNDGYGVEETVINRLTSVKNVLFVVAAGNDGPGRRTLGSPSTARLSLSVGASASKGLIQRQYNWPGAGDAIADAASDSDFMLYFSSRGPTAAGGFKPNLSAPGTELSSIQLNSAIGTHSGLDVYWGTSMATPTAAGGYALLLDAIRKYNLKNPTTPLTTNASTLRSILIESARPFDMASTDATSGAKTTGQYSWIDEGTGMLDLVAAWKKVIALRDAAVPSAVTLNGQNIELDYATVTSMTKTPDGIAYDGSRAGYIGQPALGTGLIIDYTTTEDIEAVDVERRLPESYGITTDAGTLSRQLETTEDQFVLRTVYTGANSGDDTYPQWIKAGTRDQVDCLHSPTQNFTLLGRGTDVSVNADSTGASNPVPGSTMNVCIDRNAIKNTLLPGDHSALIYAYRTVGGKVSPVASFVVPVSLTVPNKALTGSTHYSVSSSVQSFGINRNYVYVPKGTSLVKVTIGVPEAKNAPNDCSFVQLMSLLGTDQATYMPKDPSKSWARSCGATGLIKDATQRTTSFTIANPTPGIWDLPVFGFYMFSDSNYSLQVDYLNDSTSITKIATALGNQAASGISGSFTWTLKDTSLAIAPDATKSTLTLTGLQDSTTSQVAQDGLDYVSSGLGQLRTYPDSVKSVTVSIGQSPGNDIDLVIFSCDAGTTDTSKCLTQVGISDGPTDSESVTFTPEKGQVYAALVIGSTVNDDGNFVTTETLTMASSESGEINVSAPNKNAYTIGYGVSATDIASSKLFSNALFTTGNYSVFGNLSLLSSDGTPLSALPIAISK